MIKNGEKLVRITAQRYYELLKAEDELNCLENFGVDNWCGYGEHRDEMESEDDLLDEVYSNVIN
jgi:hypothetical protein